ncbi:MAG: hypothetical protein AAFX85_08645, partial [Pseudomonadota bacterium]
TSKLMTHVYVDTGSDYPGSSISVARRDHYCRAIQVRLRNARIAQSRSDVNDNTDFCGKNRKLAEGISADSALRGATDFNLPRSNSAFSSISVTNLCAADLGAIVGSGSKTFQRRDSEAVSTIGVMVRELLG